MRDGQSGGSLDRYGAAARARLSPFVADEVDAYEQQFEGDTEWSAEQETPPTTPVRARILWPALGFPAVIAPRARPAEVADATRCICVLLLSNRKALSKAEAARYLRCVPWAQRTRRHIAPGQPTSFAEEELSVKNETSGGAQALVIPGATDRHSTMIRFGFDHDGENGIVVDLANSVRAFYERQQMRYLHEIRIYEHASARLQDGQYHLFWNNEVAREGVPSDEMALLLQQFAPGRREGLGALWKSDRTRLLEEYEYEYGNAHLPYARPNAQASAGPRTELLHPLFVRRTLPASLKIGQLTDIHVDVRADVYEENLRQANLASKLKRWTPASYNNWNRNFATAYATARDQSDVLLLTGDLVDYGRGHWGPDKRLTLGQDGMYHVDRNWFLFYYLLASGERYTKPAYTILGNHDWRLNPYPPFAVAGTPAPKVFVNNHTDFSADELKGILKTAHGPGSDPSIAYNLGARGILSIVKLGLKALAKIILTRQTMDERGTPVETTVKSVEWYLQLINPFLDYAFKLPSEHRVLMLDWAEDENVLFPVVDQGKEYPLIGYALHAKDREKWSDPGPKAKRSLTDLQKRMLDDFASAPGKAKVIGIHAPPVGPYSDWTDKDLYRGHKRYPSSDARGPTDYGMRYPNGTIERWNGHPFFALRPSGASAGVQADYGSFERARDVFLKLVTADRAGIRLVFSGHIHRACLLTIDVPATGGKAVVGTMRVWGLSEQLVRGARPPRVSPASQGAHGPLFVVGTSLGPIGHYYPTDGPDVTAAPGYIVAELASDGTIRRVDFKPPMPRVLPVAAPKAVSTHEMGALVGQ